MKKLLAILLFTGISFAGMAQCEEYITGQTLQKGMFIFAGQSNNRYVAEILSANGTDFTCRFLHSNSVYEFTDFKKKPEGTNAQMLATVKSNKGGGYAPGNVFFMNVYMRDPDACDLKTVTLEAPTDVIATFAADNKSYLGRMGKNKNGTGYSIKFSHSNSKYELDNNFIVTSIGGAYKKGSQLKVIHARTLNF